MSQTDRHAWPTPDDTDRVSAGAAAMRALAGAIDTDLPLLAQGVATLTLTGSDTAALDVNVPGWPADVGGQVYVTARHSSGNYVAAIVSRGNGTFRVRVTHVHAATASTTVNVDWLMVSNGNV